jgi:hypothetical protein
MADPDYSKMSDEELDAVLQGKTVPKAAEPDYSKMSDAELHTVLTGGTDRATGGSHMGFAVRNAMPADKSSGVADPFAEDPNGPAAQRAGAVARADAGSIVQGAGNAVGRVAHDVVNPVDLTKDALTLYNGLGGLHERIGKTVVNAVKNPVDTANSIANWTADHPANAGLTAAGAPGVGGFVGAGLKAGATLPLSVVNKVVQPLVERASGVGGKYMDAAYDAGRRGGKYAEDFKEQYYGNPDDMDLKGKPVDNAIAAADRSAQKNSADYLANKKNWIPDGKGGFIPPNLAPVKYNGVLQAMADADAAANAGGAPVKGVHGPVNAVNDEITKRLAVPGPELTPEKTIRNPSGPHNPINPLTGEPTVPTQTVPAVHGPGPAYNVEGADTMKKSVGSIIYGGEKAAPENTAARVHVGRVQAAIKQAIVDAAPNYAGAMAKSQDALQTLQELRKTMSLTERASVDTALGKLHSAMKSDVSGRGGYRAALLDELSKYAPTLPHQLAGQIGQGVLPYGLSGRLLPALVSKSPGAAVATAILGAPVTSPRLVQWQKFRAGQAMRGMSNTADTLTNALRARQYTPSTDTNQ